MLCSFWWLEFGRRRKISGRITWSRWFIGLSIYHDKMLYSLSLLELIFLSSEYPFPQRMMLSGAGNFVNRIHGGESPTISLVRREFPWIRRKQNVFIPKATDDRIDRFEVLVFTKTQNLANIVYCRIAANFQFPKPSSIMWMMFITRY